MSGWLFNEQGYFAIGYDNHFGFMPCWSKTGDLAEISVEAVQWVHDATEVEGSRRVEVYYVDNSGTPNGPDFEIRTLDNGS